MLWLNGMAGTGKSTIARTVARELHDQGLLGASFFFSQDGGEALSRIRLFYVTLASQLAKTGPAELRHEICKAAESHPDVLDKSRTFQWTNLILQPLKMFRKGVGNLIRAIVIDALDECDDENDISALIGLLQRTNEVENISIRILVVSRPDSPIRDGFGKVPALSIYQISLDEQNMQKVDNDIRLYLLDRFRAIKREKSVNHAAWPAVRSVSRLVRLSGGLFIYAATACTFIQEDIDRTAELSLSWFLEEMERAEQQAGPQPYVDHSPMDHTDHLDRMYTRILQNALRDGNSEEKQNRLSHYLKDILGAIVALREPLAAASLQNLRRQDNENIQWRLSRLHSVIRVPRDVSSPLRLSHVGFRDFLLNRKRCRDDRFALDPVIDHDRLFGNCMKALETALHHDICGLRHPCASTVRLDIANIERALPPWVQYACKSWTPHMILGGDANFVEAVHIFLRSHLLHWLEAMSLIGQVPEAARMLGELYVHFGELMVSNTYPSQVHMDFECQADHRFSLDDRIFSRCTSIHIIQSGCH
jgi:hypothetical protein